METQYIPLKSEIDMQVGDTMGVATLEWTLSIMRAADEAGSHFIDVEVPEQTIEFKILAGFERQVIHREKFQLQSVTIETHLDAGSSWRPKTNLLLRPFLLNYSGSGKATVVFA